MGTYTFCQHEAATTYCKNVPQNTWSPLSIWKTSSERSKLGIVHIVKVTTAQRGGRLQILGRANFTEPKWLLPVQEEGLVARKDATPSIWSDAIDASSSRSHFQVDMTTSKDYNSGISDFNAGILLAMIGEHGRCFVHRISPLVSGEVAFPSDQTKELWSGVPTHYRFQRGSKDVVTFSGPDLGKLEAVWVAPEEGTWRLEDISITVFPQQMIKDGVDVKDADCRILQYNFPHKDILIGDGNGIPAAELKASTFSELFYADYLLLNSNSKFTGTQMSMEQVRDEGMKEYKALKFSLLSYNALLVTLGSAVSVATGNSEIAEGFCVGGLLGFIYLFILQRAVDQLPAPSSSPLSIANESLSPAINSTDGVKERSRTSGDVDGVGAIQREKSQLLGGLAGFRAPLTKFSGIIAVSAVIAKIVNTANNHTISKEMLFAGAAGFLMSKIATVLASNKPLSISLQK